MRPDPIDSTQQILPPAQILVEFLKRYADDKLPIQVSLIALAHELNMEDAESIQFGNTAFISHYSREGTDVFMRALNVDSAANFVDNIENYVAHVYRRGVKNIITVYEDDSITGAIRAVKKRIERLNKTVSATVSFDLQGARQTTATIRLKPPKG